MGARQGQEGSILPVLIVGIILLAAPGCGQNGAAPSQAASVDIQSRRPAPGPALPPQAPTRDPRLIVQRMVAAYKALDSLQVTSEADIRSNLFPTSPVHQTMILKYQKHPARIAMMSKDPGHGTHQYFANGMSLVHYSGLANEYIRRALQGNLAQLCKVIDRETPGVLSPVIFLQSGIMPLGVDAVRLVGTDTVDGRPAYVIKGTFTPAYLRDLARRIVGQSLNPTQNQFTLRVDQANYLLLKSSVQLSWKGKMQWRSDKPREVTFHFSSEERVTEAIQNPRFEEDEFRFFAPKGARERFIERRTEE